MNAKRKGTRNEHKTIRDLERSGYSCIRAAGSLGPFDIVAVSPLGVRLIQVKSNRPPSGIEKEAIEDFRCMPPNATKEVWLWRDYARRAEVTYYPNRKAAGG